jgi:hypothetical protein
MNALTSVLEDPSVRYKNWLRAQQIADGGSACAITASLHLIAAGVLPEGEVIPWAEDLATRLKQLGWKRIDCPADVLPGDLIVCQDLNGNGATDHVWFALGTPYHCIMAEWAARCVDNHNDGEPHPRTLNGKGFPPPHTPMDYALRQEG